MLNTPHLKDAPARLPLPDEADFPFGRFAGLVPDCSTAAWDRPGVFSRRRWQRKTWVYGGAFSARHAVGLAIVDAGFLATAFVYVWDRTQKRLVEEKISLPFGFGRDFDPSLRSAWALSSGSRSWRFAPSQRGWEATFSGKRLTVSMDLTEAFRGMSTLASAQGRPFHYTYKLSGLPATLRVAVDGVVSEGEALAVIDFSKGYPPHTMFWNWASLVGQTGEGNSFGMNLVGDFNNGLENSYWLDGNTVPLGQAIFSYSARSPLAPWRIRTADDRIDLRFTPEGMRSENLRAGVLRSTFAQPFGAFEGILREPSGERSISGHGVVEQHWASW
jgi:hypothetical protein